MTFQEAFERLDAIGAHPKRTGNQIRSRCPVHEGDRGDSLAIVEGTRGADFAAICHAGCGAGPEFFNRLLDRLRTGEVMAPPDPSKSRSNGSSSSDAEDLELVSEHRYRPYRGDRPLWKKTRFRTPSGGKTFRWHRWVDTAGGTWAQGLAGQPESELPLYGWQGLVDPLPGDDATVYWVEGETSVERAVEAGLVAVTSCGGAKGPLPDDLEILRGRDVVAVADRDQAGSQYAVRVKQALAGLGCPVRIARTPLKAKGADLVDHLDAGLTIDDLEFAKTTTGGDSAADPALYESRALSTVLPEHVEWLWHGRLPKGKIVLLDGDPGVSKSTLSITLAARLSTGTPWPDGEPCPTGSTLLLTAEDGIADTVRPRLDKAGGDASKVHVLDLVVGGADKDGQPIKRPPTLADVIQIEAAVRAHRAALCIVDVLMAYLPGGTDSHRDQDVRAVMARIKDIADRTGCTFVLIRHLNKSGGAALYRGGGSIGISGAARVAWLVGRDPEDDTLVVLTQTKNNLAPMPTALSYRLVDADGVGRIEWAGAVQRSADELLTTSSAEDRDERDALAEFIVGYLADQGGEASARDCQRAVAGAFGTIGKATLKRARDRACVTTRKGGMTSGWLWSLPEGSTEGSEDSGATEPETFGTFVEPSQLPGPPERTCADCGALAESGYVRCPSCIRLMKGGAS